MNIRTPMKLKNTLRSLLLLVGCSLVAVSSASAQYYWDTNSNTAGLGDTGGLFLGNNSTKASLAGGNSRSVVLGTFGYNNTALGTGDTIYFGTMNLALGSTASTIGVVGGGVTVNRIVFGAGQGSQGVTLSGGGGTITLAGTTPSIYANNTGTNTIGAVLNGTAGLVYGGSGTTRLTGANGFTGGVTVTNGGTLQVGDGTSGSLTSQALTFNNGGGVFNVRSVDAGSTQAMGALTFANTGTTVGEGTVQSTYGTSGNAELSFSSLAARQAGATGNFVVSDGINGSTNKIVLTGAATGFLDKGLYFNGSHFAAYDSSGYVRELVYDGGTPDTNTEVTNTITASRHVRLTTSPAARAGDTLLSLKLDGGGVDYTMNSGSLTVPAILKSGGGAVSTISGGTSVTTASNAELVVRTDTSADLLDISSAVTGFSGGLTKTGAGTLTLSGSNGYTGATRINAGILAVSGGSAIADTQTVTLANAAGATLRLDSDETILSVTGGGFSDGNVNVQGNTLTLGGTNTSMVFGGQFSGTGSGGVTKVGTGKLTLSNTNTFAGTTTLSAGTLEFTYGNDGTGPLIALSSGGDINMAHNTTLAINPSTNFPAGVIGSQLQSANGGSPPYPYGWTVANDINIASGTSTANITLVGNENAVRFNGNVTGGATGNQTLSITTGNGQDREVVAFSGVIADGSSGTLGLTATLRAANNGAYLNLTNNNTFTGPIAVTTTHNAPGYLVIGGERHSSGATLVTGSGSLGSGGVYSGTISLSNTGAGVSILSYASSANQTLAGDISGAGGQLLKDGSGTLTLTAANTYTGATTINSGTLDLGGSTATGSLDSTVLNMAGGTLNYTRTGNTTQAFTTTNITAGASTITAVAGNTITLGALTPAGAATVNFGTTGNINTSTANDATGILGGWATFGGTNWAAVTAGTIGGFAGSYTTTTTAGTTAANYAGNNISVNSSEGVLSAAIAPNTLTFNTSGANTLTLTGNTNTFPGIMVNSAVGDNASLITGGTGLRGTSGGSLNIIQNNTTGANSALTIGTIIANNGTATGLNKSGAGTLILTATNTYTGITTINAGTLQLGNGGSTGALATSGGTGIVNNASLVVNRSGSLTLPVISGTGSVSNTGSTLTLNAGNTFSGGFTLNSGTVAAISGATYNGFGTGLLTINGGSLRGVNTTAATIIPNEVAWNANVGIGRASGGNPILTFNGNITLGASVGTTGTGAEPTSLTFNGNIGESAAGYGLSLNSTGSGSVWTFNGQNTFTGALNANSKSLIVGGSGYLGGGNYAGTITAAGGFTYSSSANQTLSGAISGTTLTKNTSTTSTLTLSGTNNYSGGSTISAGTLVFRNTGAQSASGTHAFAAGTTLGLGVGGAGFYNSAAITSAFGTGTILTNVTVTATTNVAIDTTAGDFTHAPDITGSPTKGLTKLGLNTLTLEGTNTYTGATLVSAGTLLVNGALGNSAVTVANGATLGGGGTVGNLSFAGESFFDIFEALAVVNNPLDSTAISFSSAGFDIESLVYNGAAVEWNTVSAGTYKLINGTLNSANLGHFGLANAFDIGGGRSAYFESGSLDLVVTAIPEPSVALIGGLGVLALLRRRRN